MGEASGFADKFIGGCSPSSGQFGLPHFLEREGRNRGRTEKPKIIWPDGENLILGG